MPPVPLATPTLANPVSLASSPPTLLISPDHLAALQYSYLYPALNPLQQYYILDPNLASPLPKDPLLREMSSPKEIPSSAASTEQLPRDEEVGGWTVTGSPKQNKGWSRILPSVTQQMEIVWHGEFDKLFQTFGVHQWSLEPTLEAPSTGDWRVFKDSAKVRFLCQQCGHGWTSMKGRVMFWFHFEPATARGKVYFCLFGQQCSTCKNGTFEHSMWYPEEVIKVIGNLYNFVGQAYYGFYRPPIRIDRRQGRPRQQHNKDLCQACAKGMCREEWKFS